MKRNIFLENALATAFAEFEKPSLDRLLLEKDSKGSFFMAEMQDVLDHIYFENEKPYRREPDISILLTALSPEGLSYYLPKFIMEMLQSKIDGGEIGLALDSILATEWSPDGLAFRNKAFVAFLAGLSRDQKDILSLAIFVMGMDESELTGTWDLASSVLLNPEE